MARATILSSLGGGLYRVRLHFDNSRIEARLAHMATKIADYTAELAALEPDKTTKTTTLNTALNALNNYINATDPAVYVADPTELNALNKATWTARGELDVILHDEKLLKLKKAALEKETELLNKFCPADFETNAWCVEYVEDLSGETQAIECDYLLWRDVANNQIEHDTGVWLPATATPVTNALIHPLASSEHATWFNLCMAPAAQRHAARYRVATLSNLNKTLNTCDLDFDGRYDVTRANGNVLDNEVIHPQFADAQQNNYIAADIVYGTCNAEAFQNGDRVVVDLHSGTGAPTVIGFHDNPRQCIQYQCWTSVAGHFSLYTPSSVGSSCGQELSYLSGTKRKIFRNVNMSRLYTNQYIVALSASDVLQSLGQSSQYEMTESYQEYRNTPNQFGASLRQSIDKTAAWSISSTITLPAGRIINAYEASASLTEMMRRNTTSTGVWQTYGPNEVSASGNQAYEKLKSIIWENPSNMTIVWSCSDISYPSVSTAGQFLGDVLVTRSGSTWDKTLTIVDGVETVTTSNEIIINDQISQTFGLQIGGPHGYYATAAVTTVVDEWSLGTKNLLTKAFWSESSISTAC